MDDLVSKLSEMRSGYNCFDEAEEPQYRALSDAIKILSNRADGDTISRQAAIDAIARMMPRSYTPDGSHPADKEIFLAQEVFADCIEALEILPSAQPDLDEWCTDCKEYDTESKCCPRFNRVIRSAVDERKRGRWIDLRQEGDSRFMCSVCKWKENVPTCMGKPTVWEYCPSCGARMDGDGNG